MLYRMVSPLRNPHTVIQSDCTNPYSHQQHRSLLHTLEHLLPVDSLMIATLLGARQHITAASICTSLITSNAKHLVMCPVAICTSSMLASLIYTEYRSVTPTVFISFYISSTVHFPNLQKSWEICLAQFATYILLTLNKLCKHCESILLSVERG